MFTSFANIFGPIGIIGPCGIPLINAGIPAQVSLCVPNQIDGGIPNFLVTVSVPHILSPS